MATGTIKALRTDKGFGFIKLDGAAEQDADIFFHRTAVDYDGFDQLEQGQRVDFDIQPDQRDPSRSRASKVTPIT
jgi:CspA family cold shock protein